MIDMGVVLQIFIGPMKLGGRHSVFQGEIGNRGVKERYSYLFHSVDMNAIRIFHPSLIRKVFCSCNSLFPS